LTAGHSAPGVAFGGFLCDHHWPDTASALAAFRGHMVATNISMFSLEAVGGIARQRGLLPQACMSPANRLVYYLAIPGMIVRAVSGVSLTLATQFFAV
jgi:hypothetical protein